MYVCMYVYICMFISDPGLYMLHTVCVSVRCCCLVYINAVSMNFVFLCGSVVEHCVSCAKGCGFDSQGTHVLMNMYNLNAIVSRFG